MNTTNQAVTGESNASRVSVGANVRKAAKSLFDSYVYGGSSIEGIATTIVGYTPEHAALLALEVASYMTDLQERELRRAIRNGIEPMKGKPNTMSETPTETINRLYTEKRQAERQRDELMAALKELSGAIEEHGSLEVDKNGNPVNQNAAGRNYDRRCEARAKALNAIAKAEQTIKN